MTPKRAKKRSNMLDKLKRNPKEGRILIMILTGKR